MAFVVHRSLWYFCRIDEVLNAFLNTLEAVERLGELDGSVLGDELYRVLRGWRLYVNGEGVTLKSVLRVNIVAKESFV